MQKMLQKIQEAVRRAAGNGLRRISGLKNRDWQTFFRNVPEHLRRTGRGIKKTAAGAGTVLLQMTRQALRRMKSGDWKGLWTDAVAAFHRWTALWMMFSSRLFRRGPAGIHSAVSMKKKTVFCSAEAAAVSIGIHLLLIIFAGSWIIFQHAKKEDAAFSGENISRPKLERRQLQMPVKMQNLQKKSQRPKVTSRIASASKTSFALPDMSGLGSAGSGLVREGTSTAGRELSSMGAAGSLGFGVSSVNFFGARSKGEKLVFVIDASQTMMLDEKGGYNTYKFAKDKIFAMINGLQSATLFNVMVYGDQSNKRAVMFQSQLVPATPENREALKNWLEPLNSDPKAVGSLKEMTSIAYVPAVKYDTMIGSEAKSWLETVQAAMEQGADNIFVLCAGWGQHVIGPEGSQKLGVDPAKEKEWLLAQGWTPERIAAADKASAEFNKKVDEMLAAENKQRAANGLPPKILDYGARWRYVTKELKLTPPPSRPRYGIQALSGRNRYDQNEISSHLKKVYEDNYIPKKLSKPQIHFVRLIAEDDTAAVGDDDSVSLKRIATSFRGRYEFLRGAKTMENLIKYNDVGTE